jgi:hypothetical protein
LRRSPPRKVDFSRVHSENDLRSILVVLPTKDATPSSRPAATTDAIEQRFSGHLSDAENKALTRALENLSSHARPPPRTHP